MTARDPLFLFLTAWAASAVLMVVLWLIERRLKNLSIADVGWCYALALVLLWYAGSAPGEPARRLLVALMVCLYALRLGTHVLVDRLWNRPEDGRYRALRLQWGAQGPTRRFWYFQLQATAVTFFSLPPLVVMQNPHPPFHFWDLIGLLWWGVAVTGETIADRQLAAFRNKPWNNDRVCRIGLWRYSRHPNYFFEFLFWIGIFVASLTMPWGWLTVVCPLLMYYFLTKVTGIPLTEEYALKSKGEAYGRYQQTTSAFVPWFRRNF